MSDKTTFKDLTAAISESSGHSQRSTVKFIRDLTEIVENGLRKEGEVSFGNFGKLELKRMKSRKGVNPITGKEITVPEQNKVVFKPFKHLRDLVNDTYSHMEPQVLDGTSDTAPEPVDPVSTSAPSPDKAVPAAAVSEDENAETIDDLVYERPSPLKR